MKALKIIGIVLLVIYIILTTIMSVFFLFSGYGAGVDILKEKVYNKERRRGDRRKPNPERRSKECRCRLAVWRQLPKSGR